jgi:hypothetical protein
VEYSLSGAARFLPIHSQTSIKRDRTAQFYHILKPNATLASAAIASLGSSVLVTYLPPPHNVAKTEKIKLKCRTETRTYPATCTWERDQTFAHLGSCATATLFPAPAATFATCRQCTIFPLLVLHHGAPPCVTREKWGGGGGGRHDDRATRARRCCNTPTTTAIGWEVLPCYKTIIKQR